MLTPSLFLCIYVDDIEQAGREQNIWCYVDETGETG